MDSILKEQIDEDLKQIIETRRDRINQQRQSLQSNQKSEVPVNSAQSPSGSSGYIETAQPAQLTSSSTIASQNLSPSAYKFGTILSALKPTLPKVYSGEFTNEKEAHSQTLTAEPPKIPHFLIEKCYMLGKSFKKGQENMPIGEFGEFSQGESPRNCEKMKLLKAGRYDELREDTHSRIQASDEDWLFSRTERSAFSDGKRRQRAQQDMALVCAPGYYTPVKSVRHHDKIKLLEVANCNELSESKIPIKAFLQNEELKIGEGSLGTRVYVGVMEDGREVAVKRLIRLICENTARNELEIFELTKTIKSPYIVNYWDYHIDKTFMYVVVDLCEETLKQFIPTRSAEYLQEHSSRMIKEILLGLNVLHNKGILHRDLKPSNILVSVDGRMQLADFGISRVLNDDETTVLTEAKGTDGWIPPEVIKELDQKGCKGRYKKKSDVHVAGMISFFILTKGEHPFGTRLERMSNIMKGEPVLLEKVQDPTSQQFILWLISHDIAKRPYAGEALEHCLLKKQN